LQKTQAASARREDIVNSLALSGTSAASAVEA
jgi:hypothetical protein